MDKRTVSTALAKYAVNPIVSRVAGSMRIALEPPGTTPPTLPR